MRMKNVVLFYLLGSCHVTCVHVEIERAIVSKDNVVRTGQVRTAVLSSEPV